jgi:hypothetical protein
MKTQKIAGFLKGLVLMAAVVTAGILAAGCGADGACSADQVEVSYLGTSNDRTECEPIPAACGAEASCDQRECISAMYSLCEAPAHAVGCSDMASTPIISCNE